jgi:stage II sporulation protein D
VSGRGWRRLALGALVGASGLVLGVVALPAQPREALEAPAGSAYFIKSLNHPADRREVRADILDTPVLPGSIAKAATLAAALESQVVDADSSRLCRRTITVNGRRYVCAHPDLKRPLNAVEALAHSCNAFFVSLAPRLPRAVVNDVRTRAGLAPIAPGGDYAAALVGLEGPRVTPRALVDVVARLAGVDPDRPVALQTSTRRVLLDGLKGAAAYGTASALTERRVTALAKTGTAPMPGGSWMGLVVALVPAERPTHGLVVVAPGAGGLDAAAIAADLLAGTDLLTKVARASPGSDRSRDPRLPADRPAAVGAAMPSIRGAQGSGGSPDPPVAEVADRRDPRAIARPVRIASTTTGRASIATLDLEDYVAQVVSGEGEPRAAAGAQQALAITARTFALANLNRHRRDGYDFCDTTHCQVFRPATAAARDAAAVTAGRVLLHQGQPATVFYSALCGGHSELASRVWPGAVDYAAQAQPDQACANEPPWESDVRVDLIERALRDAGHRGSRLRGLRVLARNDSGRVARLQVDGYTPSEISGHDFRMAVGRVAGWQRMKSTAFDVRRIGAGYRFRGRGFGHGVGLCVIGAGRRAASGGTAQDILGFYFPTLSIGNAGPPIAATLSQPVPAETRADVRVALPADEEGERARLVDLIRRARDEIATASGSRPPTAITVTVHPTVEAFARATGQPWWVSGTTSGTAIELLPLTLLRQRGQLERTIRHEVAHVLLDGELAGRPLWVREGAASFFAAGAGLADSWNGRPSCPRDDEFTRPLSAGTHRAAYARAEACFRHAMRDARDWRHAR